MFKSIEYKLTMYLLLVIVAVACGTYLIIAHQYIYAVLPIMLLVFSIVKLQRNYKRFNKNILFLLNALDNGDYSFNFSTGSLSRREKELNIMMNRIKEIISKAKVETIENERFMSLIIESVSTGIIIINDKGLIQATNKAVNEILGLPVFTHLNQLAALDESFPQQFANIELDDQLQIKICNEREEMQVTVRASLIKIKGGTHKIITLNNIGNELEAKEMESWIRLIRVMTHEIMNSIAPITSLTDTMLFAHKYSDDEEELKTNTIEALETISTTAKGLLSFVDSYRRFTGIPNPQMNEFQLAPLLYKLVQLEEAQANSDKVSISYQCDESIMLNADVNQISQIVINLIKNAIEAISDNRQGVIRVEASQEDGKLRIKVKNNGEAIPEEVIPHIFIPFFTTKDNGSGIGLSVSRYIMRLHGGNMQVQSTNEWTTFTLTFNL